MGVSDVFLGHAGDEVEAAGAVRLRGPGASLAKLNAVEYPTMSYSSPLRWYTRVRTAARPCCFLLEIDDKKHYFSAASLEERAMWMDAISMVITGQHRDTMAKHQNRSNSTAAVGGDALTSSGYPGADFRATQVAAVTCESPSPGDNIMPVPAPQSTADMREAIAEVAMHLSQVGDILGIGTQADAMQQLLPQLQADRDVLAQMCDSAVDEGILDDVLMWLDVSNHLIQVIEQGVVISDVERLVKDGEMLGVGTGNDV